MHTSGTNTNLPQDAVAFPVLSDLELALGGKFGTRCSFQQGEALFSAGDHPFDCYLILAGEVCIVDVSTGEPTCVLRYGPGHFTGDIDLFTGRLSVVTAEAMTAVEAVRIPPAKVREMFVRAPVLGERLWRAMQRRRELLLATGFQGLRVYGDNDDKATLEVVEFLFRNGVPHCWMNTAVAENARQSQQVAGPTADLRYPIITCGKTLLFQAPSLLKLAEHIGLRHRLPEKTYDVLVLGSGPAGLGAAVYAASEGLSILVLDGLGPGGQAGSSSKIENYAGFPNGLAGRELALRSYLQALKFGADFVAPCHVDVLRRENNGLYRVHTREGDAATARTVIVATGISYQLLDVGGLDDLKGAGVYYHATAVEALLCKSCPVHVIGAGNSAGQAAMFLSQFARAVTLVVRGGDLRKSMSSYLSDRVLANAQISVRYHTQAVSIEGHEHITAVHLRADDGKVVREETTGLFIFIGAKPRTDFLPPELLRDEKGFALTGPAVVESGRWTEARAPEPLETSLPGVFASGDCRSGTTKRVAFAIGDGALAVTCVHNVLGTYVV
jgi:thioredoxin reductase (NADPH)